MKDLAAVERGTFLLRIVSSAQDARTGDEIRFRDPVTIGRGDDCDVVLADTKVSRQHARVEHTGDGSIRVVDLGSANGVWVGSERFREIVLRLGEQFRIGATIFEYQEQEPAPPVETREPVGMADERTLFIPTPKGLAGPPPLPPLPAVITSFVIRVLQPSEHIAAGTEFVVDGTSASIGRARGSTVVIDERDV